MTQPFERYLRFAICTVDENDKVIATTDPLSAEWTHDMENSLKEFFNVSMSTEVGQILVEELKRSIKVHDIETLIEKTMQIQETRT